jgi:hypothetical protein
METILERRSRGIDKRYRGRKTPQRNSPIKLDVDGAGLILEPAAAFCA